MLTSSPDYVVLYAVADDDAEGWLKNHAKSTLWRCGGSAGGYETASPEDRYSVGIRR